jgi:hypothetical protein
MVEGLPPGCLVGAPEEVLEQILVAHQRVPFTHFSFWMLLPGLSAAAATASLELFAERIPPGLQAVKRMQKGGLALPLPRFSALARGAQRVRLSLESLKWRIRCGCRPWARQMR